MKGTKKVLITAAIATIFALPSLASRLKTPKVADDAANAIIHEATGAGRVHLSNSQKTGDQVITNSKVAIDNLVTEVLKIEIGGIIVDLNIPADNGKNMRDAALANMDELIAVVRAEGLTAELEEAIIAYARDYEGAEPNLAQCIANDLPTEHTARLAKIMQAALDANVTGATVYTASLETKIANGIAMVKKAAEVLKVSTATAFNRLTDMIRATPGCHLADAQWTPAAAKGIAGGL